MAVSVIYTLPNLLTYSRILAVPAIAVALYLDHSDQGKFIALGLFLFASVTDFFDGWLARRLNLQSNLGRMLDPIADKLLVAVVIVMLTHQQTVSGFNIFPAIVILCREILVSGLREYLAAAAVSVPVSNLAKWKTAFQMTALGFLIVNDAGREIFIYTFEAGIIFLWIAAGLTVYTGYDYLRSGIARAVSE